MPDAMVNLLSSFIFTVTAYHELLGTIVDYVLLPSTNGFRLTKKDPSKIDLQSFLNTSIIGASTSLRMPSLMNKFSNFFGKGGAPEWEIHVWQHFQDRIKNQSKKVKEDGVKGNVEFK